jgi:hypothetical protein
MLVVPTALRGKDIKSEDWAQLINMGLYYYEQDLHTSHDAEVRLVIAGKLSRRLPAIGCFVGR